MSQVAEQRRRVIGGLEATALLTVVALLIWGWPKAQGTLAMGGVAVAMQLLSAHLVYRTGVAPTVDHLKVYLLGMFLRMLGVAVLGLMVVRYPQHFSLWPSALGYLGTVLPLLYLETRLAQ